MLVTGVIHLKLVDDEAFKTALSATKLGCVVLETISPVDGATVRVCVWKTVYTLNLMVQKEEKEGLLSTYGLKEIGAKTSSTSAAASSSSSSSASSSASASSSSVPAIEGSASESSSRVADSEPMSLA
jgi:hypothetical protein